jgi:hypothetical protein
MEILDKTNWPYFEAYKSSTTGEILKKFVHIMKKLDDTGAGSHFFAMDNAAIGKTSDLKELFRNSNHQMCL